MLTSLDQVNWSNIHDSEGTAEMYPEWLTALLQDKRSVWSSNDYFGDSPAFSIFAYSNHQDSIYEVTSYVVPFIYQLLTIVPERRRPTLVWGLISYVISCLGYKVSFTKLLEENVHDLKYITEEFNDIERTLLELRRGLPILLSALKNKKLRHKKAVIGILSAWKNDDPLMAAELQALLMSTTDPYVKKLIPKILKG